MADSNYIPFAISHGIMYAIAGNTRPSRGNRPDVQKNSDCWRDEVESVNGGSP